MADPKYANLFGIAYDQPDVYETADLPESDQSADIYEEETDVCIEKLHISAPEAFSKFKDKMLIANKVDFSDRLGKSKKTGYDSRSGEWVLAGFGDNETVVQKFQRLQCEMKELLEEISSIKATAKEEALNESVPHANFSEQLDSMINQLTTLNLQESLGNNIYSENQAQGDQIKRLLTQLDMIRANSTSKGVRDNKGMEKSDQGKDSVIRYQLAVAPSHVALAQSTRLADLEHRLNQLEKCVGGSSSKLARLGGGNKSLVEVSQYVAAKASLLDPTVLEAAELRVGSLITKLDQVMEKSAAITGVQDSEKMEKIEKLSELAKEMEQISKVLPETLERMNAIKSLHQQSSEFTKKLSDLELLQGKLTTTAEANSDQLKQVEENIVANFESVKTNMESLNSRIQVLQEKQKKFDKK